MVKPQTSFQRRTAAAVRVLLLAIAATRLLTTAPAESVGIAWLAATAAVAVPAVVLAGRDRLGPLTRSVEAALVVLAAATAPTTAATAVLPYLPVPLVTAAVYRRRVESVVLAGSAAGALAVLGLVRPDLRTAGYAVGAVEWLAIALFAVVAVTTQHQSLRVQRHQPQPYAEATRLLTQLRGVARQLPGATLDPGGLAEHLLYEIRSVAPAARAAVLSASGGGRLVVLAQVGTDQASWETALDADSAVSDAWASQQPQTATRSQVRHAAGQEPRTGQGEVSVLVVPLIAGVRTVGLVVLEADGPGAYPQHLVATVGSLAQPAALRLEAALLFDEVRSIATTEERQRLAREIHDGVAQELVMVGYGIDNAIAALPDAEAAAEDLRALRGEVTRVITELRLSLFELRSAVDRYGGLTAAIADYARAVGASAGLRVHLSLDDSTARLPSAVEAELLRIAQEAITNARKHARAENLWVTCAVDPPYAQITISDDGKGIADPHPDGRYGLAIMAERAERIRGRLEITPRVPNGTTVAVVLGTAPRRGSV